MSYRDTFRMLVSYVSTLISIAIDNLKISDIMTDVIAKFLDWSEIERKASVSSRNNRLAAIKAFAKFLRGNLLNI
ncbi:site-specific integrase [Bacteroides xylanisolvens]|uniref:site-specific integrase n=1 Tax=Bacteroides xylanisolvens TaxID=371601 RepID=UPI0021659426|nr:site-specific integrase [Bacteroides xylanisolvens]MCS2626490.1 site-specific integrase [Bacteroides xylanisolvens]